MLVQGGSNPEVPVSLTKQHNADEIRRVLLVEDNLGDATLVKVMLTKSNGTYQIEHVRTLEAAICALQQNEFDVVLLDLSLPDAIELESVKALHRISDVPLIVMSGTREEKIAINSVAAGAQDYLTKDHVDAHLLHRSIGYAIERKASEEKLSYLAHFDAVTGLVNRASFLDAVAASIEAATHHKRRWPAVFLLDLDRFKSINDTMGHSVGDLLLKQVADRLNGAIDDEVLVARFGGDEFALLIESENQKGVSAAAENVVNALNAVFTLGRYEMRTAASLGIAYPSEGYNAEELVRNADLAMYRAKEKGGARYSFFDAQMHESALRKQRLEQDLYDAVEREEFRLQYQSINDTHTKAPVAFEALIRWHHAELGVIRPDHFVPILEETGLIVPVGHWVLKNACLQLAKWQSEFNQDLRIAVNFSARQFEDPHLVEKIKEAVNDAGISAQSLEIEVTESLLMKNLDLAENTLKQIRDFGVRIAIDDFGTGYSQLVYLVRFPISTLKVDRSVTQTIGSSEGNKLVQAVIDLGHNLGFEIVGEGVETQEQLDFLNHKTCDTYQGYLTSKPMAPVHVSEWLSKFPKVVKGSRH